MKCPQCGFENRPGVKFCEQCGQPLVVKPKESDPIQQTLPCSQCGFVNRPGVKFCENCGETLALPKPASSPRPEKSKTTKQKSPKKRPAIVVKNKFKLAFWILLIIAAIIGIVFLINAMTIKYTRAESLDLANSIVYSTYPEFSGVQPRVEHQQKMSTYAYATDVVGTLPSGEEVDITRYIVIEVNRKTGNFKFTNAY